MFGFPGAKTRTSASASGLSVGGGEFDRDLMPREQIERRGRTRHQGERRTSKSGEKRLAAARQPDTLSLIDFSGGDGIPMKITVFGAGAVGGHVAARLGAAAASAGIEVAAVGRGAQLDAIRERGLTLWIGDERYDSRIHATDRPETLGVQDVVFVALKSSTLPQAAPAIASLARPGDQRRLRDERHSVVVSLSLLRRTACRAPICRGSTPAACWRAPSGSNA